MRLPTVNQYRSQISAMSRQFDAVEQVRQQVDTGKKIQHASEDPLLASKINIVSDFMGQIQGYNLNVTLAANRSGLACNSMQQGVNNILEAKNLIQTAQNDTLNDMDRNNIAIELQQKLDRLVQIANTQDNNGEYIFSGMSVSTQPYKNQGGGYVYLGNQNITNIAIGLQNSTPYNDSGFDIFGDIQTGNGIYSIAADVANNTGTCVVASKGLVPGAVYIPDEYSITFVTNSSGQLAYQVTGASTGQIIPAPPLNAPNDAPLFVAGEVAFNGINIDLSGQPNEGDVFTVSKSTTQNIFDTLQQVINTLKTPVTSDKDRADLHQALNDQALSVNQAFDHVNTYLTELGIRGKNIDDQGALNKEYLIEQETVLGRLSNVDMGVAISDLTQRLTILDVTQQTYLQIQETFNRLLYR